MKPAVVNKGSRFAVLSSLVAVTYAPGKSQSLEVLSARSSFCAGAKYECRLRKSTILVMTTTGQWGGSQVKHTMAKTY